MGFTNADIRASHTIRIFGTNKDEEVLQDIWLDIERIDVYRVTTQSPTGQFQGIYRRLYWLDDPDDPSYTTAGNPARTEGVKKICSPDEADQEDPAEWIPVKTIVEMAWNESSDHNQWKARRGNRTDAENLVRTVAARRCFHRDTTIDDEVDAATDEDPNRKAYVVASDRYDFVEDSEDKDNFIEVQYVSYTFDQSSRKEDEGKNQGVQYALKNSHYLKITDPAKGPNNPVHGFDPPWALDPFQAIINCQFGTYDNRIVMVNESPPDTIVSTNGVDWQRLGPLAYDGASDGINISGLTRAGWRRDDELFNIYGVKTTFDGVHFINEDIVMSSPDGIHWSRAGSIVDTANLFYAYSKKAKRRAVGGYVYRVAGGSVHNNDSHWNRVDDKRYNSAEDDAVVYARVGGTRIERCADTSAKEDDDSKPWETVLGTTALYRGFGPLTVIKGDGPDDKATLVCVVNFDSDVLGPPLTKDGILSSTDGETFEVTFYNSMPSDDYSGSIFALCSGRFTEET